MLEILPSMSAGSDNVRNGFISRVDGGKLSSFTWLGIDPGPIIGGPGVPLLPPALFLRDPMPLKAALGWPSWACFKCCFILSGRENSFWHIVHGKTLRAAPSWYRKACLWKLYLFLKCLLICTRSHSTHLVRKSEQLTNKKLLTKLALGNHPDWKLTATHFFMEFCFNARLRDCNSKHSKKRLKVERLR